jgi:hypothetical protein
MVVLLSGVSIMLSVINWSFMLSVVMLNVFMLNVVAPFDSMYDEDKTSVSIL